VYGRANDPINAIRGRRLDPTTPAFVHECFHEQILIATLGDGMIVHPLRQSLRIVDAGFPESAKRPDLRTNASQRSGCDRADGDRANAELLHDIQDYFTIERGRRVGKSPVPLKAFEEQRRVKSVGSVLFCHKRAFVH
jgi:hypothetical protein